MLSAKQKAITGLVAVIGTAGIAGFALGGGLAARGLALASGDHGRSRLLDMKFPEERRWFEEAGLQHVLKYADYIRPNVGLSEKDLGMPILKYRNLERSVAAAVLARDPKDVANEIKRTKYGVTNIGPGAPDLPPNTNFGSNTPETKAAYDEYANCRKTPSSINKDMGDYVLGCTDAVLQSNGISPSAPANRLIRASLFAKGVYYLFEGMSSRSIDVSIGPGMSNHFFQGEAKSIFSLDLPRGQCAMKSAAFVYIVNAESEKLGISAGWTNCFGKFGKYKFYLNRNAKVDHADALVTYQGHNVIEAYDPTNRVKLDTKDPNARALWAVTTGDQNLSTEVKAPPFKVNGRVIPYNSGDPVSSLSRQEFMSIPADVTRRALQVSGQFRR